MLYQVSPCAVLPCVLLELCEQAGTHRALLWSPCLLDFFCWNGKPWSPGKEIETSRNSGSHRRNQLEISSLVYKIFQIWFWGVLFIFSWLVGWVFGFVFVFYHTVPFVTEGHQSSTTCFMSLSLGKYLHKGRSVSSVFFKSFQSSALRLVFKVGVKKSEDCLSQL